MAEREEAEWTQSGRDIKAEHNNFYTFINSFCLAISRFFLDICDEERVRALTLMYEVINFHW